MKYEELQWERQSECRWRAKAPGGYEIVWEIRDDGIAVLHGQPPATGGAIRMKSTADGIARVKVALELIDKELTADLTKEAKERLIRESEAALKNDT